MSGASLLLRASLQACAQRVGKLAGFQAYDHHE